MTPDLKHTKKEEIIEMSEISLNLKTYEDIFSNFDPRPYSQRALSDDFLIEAKKVSRETAKGAIELNLLMPNDKRNSNNEALIKKRLKEYFKKHYHLIETEKRTTIKNGTMFAMVGVLLMFIGVLVLFKLPQENFLTAFLVILLEPAGWFLLWEGMYMVIFESKNKNQDLDFHKKMSNATISFHGY